MSVSLSKSSVIQWIEGLQKHSCGYCKQNESSTSNGMWAETLTVDDYQNLIDRGWRRSGKYCYKPVMEQTCCPLYTIKCDSVNLSLSKSQKKVIKKFNKFLRDGELNNKDNLYDNHNAEESGSYQMTCKEIPNIKLDNITSNISVDIPMSEPSTFQKSEETIESKKERICDIKDNESSQINTPVKTSLKEGEGPDSSKPPCKKAKILRLEKKKEKALKKGIVFEKTPKTIPPKTLEEFLEETVSTDNMNQLRTSLERMSSRNDHYGLSAELYKKYQTIIHNDPPNECNEEQFHGFLVNTPLQPESFPDGIEGPGYGSFHQQYWLNDKLIAVGVIDILPKCVSSVYFFYDPDYKSLTLGTYGSLRELQFTRQLQKSLQNLENYYMGFYIHSCPKMRYKGNLVPSFLVCPETYSWVPIEKCIPLLEVNKYSRLNDDKDALDENIPSEEDILKIKIIYKCNLINFREYKIIFDEEDKFKEIGMLVGKTCLNKLIFWEN